MPDTRKNHNPSGAPDPTRVRAESNIQREEARVSELVHVLRYVAGAAGFEIVERIVLVDNQTGRIYPVWLSTRTIRSTISNPAAPAT